MWASTKKQSGFTLVELLIVIVVIAILAAITIVSYNGIQTRTKNTKTVSAVTAWAKAIRMYNAELGTWPTVNSCLGTTSTYVDNNAQCWNSATWVVNNSFLNQVKPYMNGTPEPDTTDVVNGGANTPRRGALYHAGNKDIYAAFSGISTCPDVGLPVAGSQTETGGMYCIFSLD